MSQKKVDAYKAKKGQHGRVDKKERTLFVLEMCAWAFICVTIVGWIGYSAYVEVTGSQEAVVQNTVMDTTALDNYISGLSTDTTGQGKITERMSLIKPMISDLLGRCPLSLRKKSSSLW